MAKAVNPDEYTRFTMTNLTLLNSQGQVDKSSLKDWQTQVDAMTKAINSATNSLTKVTTQVDELGNAFASFDVPRNQSDNARTVFNQKLSDFETIYDYYPNSLMVDPYSKIAKESNYRELTFNKDFYGTKSKKELKNIVETLGGSVDTDPTKKHKDRMKITIPVSESDWQSELLNTNGDTAKAKRNITSRYVRNNLKSAVQYSDDVNSERKSKEREKEEKEKEKEEIQHRAKTLTVIALAVKALQVIADITRRILTATLARASEIKRENLDAKSLGISYENIRHYSTVENAMGLGEGQITKAIASLQNAFGNTTNLDEGALSELAKVLGSDVTEAVKMGLGNSNPEALMKSILDAYFKRGQQGINSLGHQVGQAQAERELASALEKAGLSDLADILRNMFYTNDTGIYKGRVDSFETYSNLVQTYTNGLSDIDHRKASELGQTVDALKARFNDLKKNLEEGFLLSLQGLIDKINNLDFGKSEEQKEKDNAERARLNLQAKTRMENISKVSERKVENAFEEAGIDLSVFGGKNATESIRQASKSYYRWNDTQKEEWNKIKQFIRTENGKEVINAIFTQEVTKDLAEQAYSDWKEGLKTGDQTYSANDYTDANIQHTISKMITDYFDKEEKRRSNASKAHLSYTVSHNEKSAGLVLLGDVTDGGQSAFYTTAEEALKTKLNQSGLDAQQTYEEIISNGTDSSWLTFMLYRMLPEERQNAKGGFLGLKREENRQKAVIKALKDGILTQQDVWEVQKKSSKIGGFGLGNYDVNTLHNEKIALEMAKGAGSYSAIADGLKLKEVQNIITRLTAENYKNTTVSVSGYNAQTGEVKFTLKLTDDRGNEKILFNKGIKTDSILEEGAVYEHNLSDITANANERGM